MQPTDSPFVMPRAARITARNAPRQDFIPLLRELARAYQAFASYDAAGYRDSGLTPSQADVIFALGNAGGANFKEISRMTLITKGTLTGVVDRLAQKGLVERVASTEDRRSIRLVLTREGQTVFEREFPRQMSYLKQRFDRLSKAEMQAAARMLRRVRDLF